MGLNRLLGCGIDGEAEAAGEADGPDHPQPIFLDALVGIADSANEFFFEVGLSIDVVQDFMAKRVVEHPIDGEIAPFGIFFRSGEFHFGGPAPIGVVEILAECGDFILVAVYDHQDDSECNPDGNCMRKESLDRFRGSIRRDVDIVGGFVEEKIANPASCVIGDESGAMQGFDDPKSLGVFFHKVCIYLKRWLASRTCMQIHLSCGALR